MEGRCEEHDGEGGGLGMRERGEEEVKGGDDDLGGGRKR